MDAATWSVVIVASFLFTTFMWFFLSPLLSKKPAPLARRPIENISPADSVNNHDHERKRLVSWIHQRSRDRFMAEIHDDTAKPVPLLVLASQPHERSSLVPHIKSPPQVFMSTLHSAPRPVTTPYSNDRYFTPIPPISNTLPQLPTISSGSFTSTSSLWKSNTSILSLPQNAKVNPLIRSDSMTTMERIGTYLQGSSVRDSLDLEIHRARARANAVYNRF
ncbi:hypothetical protein PILCRDRAFT_316990 [Piloderma croceum F 1598]|uniref:Uncharacterized protein n=1 Tax=Piloderma croceum (strain F 1598) TaxID=765440 RepID=A0A0C3CAT1_PILCF|nr:hypothetical protein PILCRDRAFT_316990 [Piloderma croceum F 1598]